MVLVCVWHVCVHACMYTEQYAVLMFALARAELVPGSLHVSRQMTSRLAQTRADLILRDLPQPMLLSLVGHKSHFYSARIASAVLATTLPSVCLSVRLSNAGIVSKRRRL